MSGRPNIIEEKTLRFGVRCINLHKYLYNKREIYDISRQLLKSGTSIGANVREGIVAQSKADFISKLNISLKEANETLYWINILTETKYLTIQQSDSISADCKEIIRILTSIIKTARNG